MDQNTLPRSLSDEGMVLIDRSKLSIPVETAIVDELEKALELLKHQQDQLYNFSISPDFKQVYALNKADIDAFNNKVIFRIHDNINVAIEKFKLLGMKGGGFFDFFKRNKPTEVPLSNMEILLFNLEESMSSEKIKFNGLFNNIKLYIFTLLENNTQKAALVLETINTKIATFDVIVNELVSIIKKYQKLPSTGGKKRKTHRKKRSNKTTKRRRL